jgi:hypothetical protein
MRPGAENTSLTVAAPEAWRYLYARILPGVRRIQYPQGEEVRRFRAGFQLPVPMPIVGESVEQ